MLSGGASVLEDLVATDWCCDRVLGLCRSLEGVREVFQYVKE